jgi:hypothetical protein
MGDWTNGWALVVLAGRPCFLVNLAGTGYRIRAGDPLAPGRHQVGFRFLPDGTGGGTGVVLVDETPVGSGSLPRGMGASGMQIGGGGLRLGHDAGFPVSDDYRPPFPWTGTLHQVTFDASPPSDLQLRSEAEELLRRE